MEYLFYLVLSVTTSLLPFRLIHTLAKGFGLFLYYGHIRRKVVEKNLEIAFGDSLDHKEMKHLCKKTYLNASIVAFEFISMRRIKQGSLDKHITLEGGNILEEALKEGNGAIVAGNHFGNWELITAAISSFITPLHIFSGMQKNKLIDDAINDIRQRFGTYTIPKGKSAPFDMMKALKNNQPLGMAGDLNVPHDNLFVEFFGKKAVAAQGQATFALRRQSPVIFIWNVRLGPFKYKGYLKRIDYRVTGDQQADLQYLAQLISNELEDKIRQHPDQYFWLNRRWKTRPPDDPDDVY